MLGFIISQIKALDKPDHLEETTPIAHFLRRKIKKLTELLYQFLALRQKSNMRVVKNPTNSFSKE